MALSYDPRVQSALAKVRVAEAEANQARLLPNPILGLDLRFALSSGTNQVFEPTIAEDLVSLISKPRVISAADNRLRGSVAEALTTVLDLISEVQETYAAARSADDEIANAQRRLDLLQQLRDIAQKRMKAGEGTKLDGLTLDAQVMQAEIDLADSKVQRLTERMTLARLVGQPRSAAEWSLSPWEPPGLTALGTESAWIDAALANRPEVASKNWELRALGEDLAAATFQPFQGGDVGVHAERDPDWRVGPTLTTPVPLFDFGQQARAKLRAQRIAARHDLAQQRQLVIQDVRIAYVSYQQAIKALADTEQKLLPLQRAQLDQAKLSYQAGEADLATLLLAETNFDLALSKVVELREKATVALVKLQRAAGGAAIASSVNPTAPATQPLQPGGPKK
jgi:cobalt-zinc-cadmium efflux system outer membrane protein